MASGSMGKMENVSRSDSHAPSKNNESSRVADPSLASFQFFNRKVFTAEIQLINAHRKSDQKNRNQHEGLLP
jgi:hypothetical protein